MKIAFLGTPDFAIPSLRSLYHRGDDITVFSQPDRPQGRHAILQPTAVKAEALKLGLPVLQFERIKSADGVKALRNLAPDLMVTAAFGQLLSAENLAVPRLGCINVHGSLLPKYRGAAPIQWSVINGEKYTGVTTMMTDIGMDTGDILLSKMTEIGPDETAGELYDRLAVLGGELLLDTLDQLEKGILTRVKQDEAQATKCSMLKKEDGHISFSWTKQQVHDRVRGVCPWPGAYANLEDGTPLKIWKTSLDLKVSPEGIAQIPGMLTVDGGRLYVRAADGFVEIKELQMPGSKRMDAGTFLRGHNLSGKVLS